MNFGVAAIALGLIFLAELPDKSMVAVILMSTRHRPWPVWIGACLAFVIHCGVAAAAGRLLAELPHLALGIIVTIVFAGGAVYLLVTKEPAAEAEGEDEAEKLTDRRIVLTVFAVVGVGEIGDLTEVLTANLAARYHDALSVFVGSSLAMFAVAALGVLGGRALLRHLPLAIIRRAGGIALAGLTVYSAVRLATG